MKALAVILLASSLGIAGAALAAGIGVAPFESVAPQGQTTPDVASHVAQRLATRGIGPVVGPAALGAPARFEPDHAIRRPAGWTSPKQTVK